ncbi:hypothetical protein MBLNU459_g5940t1 [Dothideomycetes sp. NU459]
MSATHPFALSVATLSDFPEISALHYHVVTSEVVRDCFMGPDTAKGREALANRYIKVLREDPDDVWIKVVDRSTGKIAAASNWKILQSLTPAVPLELEPSWFAELEPDRAQRARAILEEVREHEKTWPVPRLTFQRRGMGSMMLQWGVDLADQLFLPAYVSASPAGNQLYKRFGFQNTGVDETSGLGGSLMRREVRSTVILGGKSTRSG